MEAVQIEIADDMHLVAVTDADDLVITSAVFDTSDAAENAFNVISALMEKTGISSRDRVRGIRRWALQDWIKSLRRMKACGVGTAVTEITF